MIKIITGYPGAGKSYTLTRLAYEYLNKNRMVFVNFPIRIDKSLLKKHCKGEIYYWKNLIEFRTTYDGIILMDEAQGYFNSRRWKEMKPEDEIKFQQHRKDGLDIIGAVQNYNRVDKVLRELAQEVYLVKSIFGKLFIYQRYDPAEFEKNNRKPADTKFYFFNKKIANSYKTKKRIHDDYKNFLKNSFKTMEQALSDDFKDIF